MASMAAAGSFICHESGPAAFDHVRQVVEDRAYFGNTSAKTFSVNRPFRQSFVSNSGAAIAALCGIWPE